MKKFIFILLPVALLILLVIPSNPDQKLFVQSEGCGCDGEGSGLAYNFGTYQGQCIDSCTYKSLKTSSKTNEITVSEVLTLEGHTTQVYRPTDLESVYILFDRFAPKLNHVALIFMFAPKNGEIRGLVLSPEAIPPRDQSYSLLDGLLSRYAINYQAYSIEKYIQNSIKLKYHLKKYRLNLSADHQRNLLKKTLTQAQEKSFQTTYHLISRNCATTVLDLILDSKEEEPTMARIVWNLFDPLRGFPFEWVGTKRSLSWWDLIDPHAQWLNEPEVGLSTPTQ
jgi:hypothetical protein